MAGLQLTAGISHNLCTTRHHPTVLCLVSCDCVIITSIELKSQTEFQNHNAIRKSKLKYGCGFDKDLWYRIQIMLHGVCRTCYQFNSPSHWWFFLFCNTPCAKSGVTAQHTNNRCIHRWTRLSQLMVDQHRVTCLSTAFVDRQSMH